MALALLVVMLLPGSAWAEVELSLTLSAREVAVGEAIEVRLDAMSSDDEAPTSPELVVPSGFEVRGPRVGTRQQMSINNFKMTTQRGISASWSVMATRPGLYSIGPASVRVGGHTERAQPVQLRVLPEGQRPSRRPRRSLDPFDAFDPFNNGFDDLFDRFRAGSSFDRLPAAPLELVPEQPPDELAFLVPVLDVRSAVVGQQVTLAIYAHGAQGLFQEAPGAREPTHPDFLAHRLVEDASRQPVYQYTQNDGTRWIMAKVRELALFPLRAGRLEIGAFEFGFLGRRYGFRDGEGLRRTTPPLVVEVSEPPLAGRPPGYAGDVGRFELTAEVAPRSTSAGGSVAVTARVRGTGRLPGRLKLPERTGIEWLEPTIRDELAVTAGALGGTRTFSYLVRLTEPGVLDLGTLSLPHYDPNPGRYRVGEAALGRVNVEPGAASAAPAPGAETQGPKLSELVAYRPALRELPPPRRLADEPVFWWMLALGPTSVVAVAGALSLVRRARRRWSAREQSAATHARRALADARAALAQGDHGGLASATERAVYKAIEWSTGLKARALLRSELGRSLESAGLGSGLASSAVELLDRAGQLRFGAAGGQPAELLRDADVLVKDLTRRPAARDRDPGLPDGAPSSL